ncbi:PD-(D/E)XK nuclease-like domain-containing protein [Micromonospora sp. NPDC000207]|uniref:PD-(D/E)XK nuclease-like domain-containing protein n=1 Tax=Micromonospora sp. NPDC000207 TaxID=3154246 RepID=UPI00332EFD2C
MTITVPGVYDMTEDDYHAHPALSSTGARKLLSPSCPALFHHDRENGSEHKREFDLGHAAHMLVLGAGPEIHVVDAGNYQTKAAREDRDAAYTRGEIPLLPAEFDTVQAMAGKLRQHPRAAELFAPDGVAEQSLFWVDAETGVQCRARLDYLTTNRIVDYKTTTSANPGHIAKAVDNFGYHQQDDWYRTGAIELDLVAPDAAFTFVFQSKTPPYLVTAVELDDTALKIGYERNRLALQIFRDCTETGVWPAYSDGIEVISLPAYAERRHHEGILL